MQSVIFSGLSLFNFSDQKQNVNGHMAKGNRGERKATTPHHENPKTSTSPNFWWTGDLNFPQR